MQDVFLRIQQNSDSFDGRSTLETWATSITINLCRNWMRSRSRRLPTESTAVDSIVQTSEDTKADTGYVTHAIQQLNQDDRELIVLRYLEEMSLDDMADLMQMRKNTLEVRLYRARKRLEDVLKPVVTEASDA